ncbi:MAG: hypothetical protein COY86_04495 [Rhodobacterales bacterium CG_4_10_14_0_8_um_filter_70_9]|nr:hypothetical protein [Alphaproteobacteria bacterium]PIY73778.1 MAG: hypothetical protein COY86_04495 [Rhodobacterales bacterium CG_4_10_14_0_8_um_filter_70_9]PJA60348.1 MAG: hypothetical protein CO163_04285 [Rhodobacterales bacterium CG_4_9_14_3_um_filter_71_31]
MKRLAAASLALALIAFVVFFTNVAFGAARKGVFLGDVAEMAILLTAAVLFVIGVLAREAIAKQQGDQGRTAP